MIHFFIFSQSIPIVNVFCLFGSLDLLRLWPSLKPANPRWEPRGFLDIESRFGIFFPASKPERGDPLAIGSNPEGGRRSSGMSFGKGIGSISLSE